jgi:hypothetical protein
MPPISRQLLFTPDQSLPEEGEEGTNVKDAGHHDV